MREKNHLFTLKSDMSLIEQRFDDGSNVPIP